MNTKPVGVTDGITQQKEMNWFPGCHIRFKLLDGSPCELTASLEVWNSKRHAQCYVVSESDSDCSSWTRISAGRPAHFPMVCGLLWTHLLWKLHYSRHSKQLREEFFSSYRHIQRDWVGRWGLDASCSEQGRTSGSFENGDGRIGGATSNFAKFPCGDTKLQCNSKCLRSAYGYTRSLTRLTSKPPWNDVLSYKI
jgi:hypothetical protein